MAELRSDRTKSTGLALEHDQNRHGTDRMDTVLPMFVIWQKKNEQIFLISAESKSEKQLFPAKH